MHARLLPGGPNVLLRTCRRLEALRQEEAEEAAELRGRNKQAR